MPKYFLAVSLILFGDQTGYQTNSTSTFLTSSTCSTSALILSIKNWVSGQAGVVKVY